MPLIPLRMEADLRRRPLVAMVIGAVIFYQALLLAFYSGLEISRGMFFPAQVADPSYYWNFFIGFFRGGGPLTAALVTFFWVVVGPLLEERAGPVTVLLCFLLGAICPWFLASQDLILWNDAYWPGLGGSLACFGLAYFYLWEEDMQVFWAIPLVKFGVNSTGLFFLLLFAHLIIALAHYVGYTPWKPSTFPPPGLNPAAWLMILPGVVVLLSWFGRVTVRAVWGARRLETFA